MFLCFVSSERLEGCRQSAGNHGGADGVFGADMHPAERPTGGRGGES